MKKDSDVKTMKIANVEKKTAETARKIVNLSNGLPVSIKIKINF